ncbi:MAG: peptidoglycan DD-metalloendopeptidase family protein [Magnetococcales bacterium]|nr:peptidoglycan DD-metalloendopeptidase family protein [Magnetococcales bacterium]
MNKRRSARILYPLALPLCLMAGCVDSDSVARVRIGSGPPLAWGLEPSERIKPSQSGVYTVQPGDTLWAIAAVHGVEVEDLAQWNRLQNPDQLWVGQNLVTRAPEGGTVAASVETRLEPPVASASDIESTDLPSPPSSLVHPEPVPKAMPEEAAVDKGADGGQVKEVTRQPPLVAARAVGKEETGKSSPVPEPSAREKDPERFVALPADSAPKPRAVANEVEAPAVKSSWQLPNEAPKVWMWPHPGKVVGKFGKQGARQNNGIDIAANDGDPVVASADGIVAYADDSLPGYGNLILLRHGGFYTTAYAHNQKILVKRGQVVKAGEKIALAGRSGGTKQAQIHFELRHHIKALNPMQHLSRKN